MTTRTVHAKACVSKPFVKLVGIQNAGRTFKLLDKQTSKTVYTGTVDTSGRIVIYNFTTGKYQLQLSYSQNLSGGGSQSFSTTDPNEQELYGPLDTAGSITGPKLCSPDGSVWELRVDNSGNLTAKKLA